MRNKKGRKKQKKYLDIPMNKSSKIVLFVVCTIIAVLSLMIFTTFIIPSFSKFFWFYIRNPINDFLFHIFESFPFITDNYLFIFISLIILSGISVICINYVKVKKKEQKHLISLANGFYKILSVIIFMALIQILLTLSDYNHANINTFYLNDYIKYQYKEDDIFNLLSDLSEVIINEATSLKRENGEVATNKMELEQIARRDLNNIHHNYLFLKGAYPTKVKDIKRNINAYGFTSNYSISTDKTINNVNYLSVITHEYCHFKGILHESDAVYCSYLAGINSNNTISKYSAHLEAFSWVMSIAEKIDENKTNKIVEEVLNLCLNDDYREVCDLQVKNISKYQTNSNIIKISSYFLDNYHNEIDTFMNILDTFISKYNALLYMDGNKVELIDIKKSIEGNEDKIVEIILGNDKIFFDSISDYLTKTNRYFKTIKQQNTSYQYNEEDIGYYLNPFTTNKLSLLFESDLYNNYAYPRVIRLLLEHRSVYGIK